MNAISLNKIKLNLDISEIQTSPNGRPIRLSAISKNLKVPEKWINKTIKHHWIYTFIYLDEQGGLVSFEYDYNDNFLHKL